VYFVFPNFFTYFYRLFFEKITLMKKLYLITLLSISYVFAFSQLIINISSIPSNTPSSDKIFIAGNFNGWNPGQTEMLKQTNGLYTVALNPAAGNVEYKFTRGTWASVEGNANGQVIPNRKITYDGKSQTLANQILSWEDKGAGTSAANSTAATNVKVLKTDFFIPQLNRTRRIWIYLPKDYDANLQKKYPVLYMHDGQNIFDKTTSFAGEWEIDETLNKLAADCIVIGIDNGGANRIAEYTPYTNAKYGGGDGAKYIDFIVTTLKPYIDQNFRSKIDRENTGIGGSSLGGLISFWAAMNYQNTFGKAMVFSPSFWWNKSIFDLVKEKGKQQNMKFYIIAGEQEGDPDMVPDATKMASDLLQNGFSKEEVFFTTHADGKHQEWYWAREFGAAYQWLFTNKSSAKEMQSIDFQLFPNPSTDFLQVKFSDNIAFDTEIFSQDGKRLISQHLSSGDSIFVGTLPPSAYNLVLKNKGKVVGTKVFMKN
jgi:predicted alpha/beta superfamily hydrolase